jgi:hypothetical protein
MIIKIAHHLFRILKRWNSHPRSEVEKLRAFKCQVALPHPYDAHGCELADRMDEPSFRNYTIGIQKLGKWTVCMRSACVAFTDQKKWKKNKETKATKKQKESLAGYQ